MVPGLFTEAVQHPDVGHNRTVPNLVQREMGIMQ